MRINKFKKITLQQAIKFGLSFELEEFLNILFTNLDSKETERRIIANYGEDMTVASIKTLIN